MWSPEFFRGALLPDGREPRPLRTMLLPWQEQDFRALDPAWRAIAGLPRLRPGKTAPSGAGRGPYRRAYLERPRGHSKTFDAAVQLTWILVAARHESRGLVAAADFDQALLLRNAMDRIARLNPHLTRDLSFTARRIANGKTGSRIDFVTSNVPSSWGHDPDFVICDELCHWPRAEMWESLASSAAKRPHCLLMVLSNAGLDRGWQWQVREYARRSADWYFSSLDGPQAPWITAEHLAEQRDILSPAAYARLWLNQWQEADGEFVTLEEARACRDEQRQAQEQGQPRFEYVAAVDYAEKHDFTVGCVMHREGERVIVDRMDVVCPTSGRPTPVQWVETWMRGIASRFQRVRFVVDEFQLVGVIQRLEGTLNVRRFPFGAGKGNHSLAMTLRHLIIERRVAWYPGCGAVETADGTRDDLETELASLRLRESTGGHLRIDHLRDGVHHDDRAFTLGAACLELLNGAGESPLFEVTPPRSDGGFWW